MNEAPVIYYDGECGLCNYSIQFVIKHDKRAVCRFSTLSSEQGKIAAQNTGTNSFTPDSIIVFDGNQYLIKSDAIISILKTLAILTPVRFVLMAIPRIIRDALYDIIARNRKRIFKTNNCLSITPELRSRFII